MSDRESEDGDDLLMQQTAAGDAAAFDLFVRRHQAAVLRLARVLCRDEATAEDALQETFLAAWRHAGSYRGGPSGRSWLLAIGRNAVMRQYRRRAGEPADFEPLLELGQRAGWGEWIDPERLAILHERREVLARSLRELAPEDREILLLRDLEGLSSQETAAVLELSLAAMKSRLHRARLRYAALLKERLRENP